MDPLTLGLLGAQAAFGLGQTIAGLAKPRKKIDTEIQPEYKEAESALQNAAQSTSAAYGVARQSMSSEAAAMRDLLKRTSSSPAALLRAQQSFNRSTQSSITNLYQSELREKSNELRGLSSAKLQTAAAKSRMQALKNQLVMQENAAKDQLISAGLQNTFGALSGGVAAQQNEGMMDLYRQMYGTGSLGVTPDVAQGSSFINAPGVRSAMFLRPKIK